DLCVMGKKSYETHRMEVSMDGQIARVRHLFESVKDKRAQNTVYSLPDILMSGFAMFSLKYASLLDFEQQTSMEVENLSSVYGIERTCSDVQMRRVLDTHDPDFIRKEYSRRFKDLQKTGLLAEYEYKIGSQKYLMASCDGVQHFSSKSLSCSCCLRKEHRDGTCTYHHNMLCAALVHPQKREVFLLNCEPIVQQDGIDKNDCERNAAKRLQKNMKTDYAAYAGRYRFLFVEDALYANAPHIEELTANGHSYILNAKPDSHKTLFAQVEGRRHRKQLNTWACSQNGVTHRFEWANNLVLCNTRPDIRVNFLCCQQTDKTGKTTTFTWVTDIPINQDRVWAIMKAGRSRWKIENETFNTLKNLGYHFEHNYGHGDDHLSTMFAYLMMLAFYVDQFVQACSKVFQQLQANIKTKVKIWSTIKALFQTTYCPSMNFIYAQVAALFLIKLE
ncbi:MAG: transposase, partial [Saprospiraceae bacterium]